MHAGVSEWREGGREGGRKAIKADFEIQASHSPTAVAAAAALSLRLGDAPIKRNATLN